MKNCVDIGKSGYQIVMNAKISIKQVDCAGPLDAFTDDATEAGPERFAAPEPWQIVSKRFRSHAAV